MIYEIRGKQVILDSDLAKLYNIETKRINEAVKNNNEKFPERFCFRITMRKYIANDTKRIYNIESKLLEHDTKIDELFNKFDKQVNNHIFF